MKITMHGLSLNTRQIQINFPKKSFQRNHKQYFHVQQQQQHTIPLDKTVELNQRMNHELAKINNEKREMF